MEGFFSRKETESRTRPDGKTYSCISCGLIKGCNTPKMRESGGFKKRILNIGTIPSKSEDRSGKQFKSKPFRMLEKAYKEIGIDLYEDCANIYSVCCYSENDPTKYQIECCRKAINKTIEKLNPQVIVLLGESPLYSIIGNRWKKGFGNMNKWRGWTIPDQEFKTWIVPTFAPESILNNRNPAYEVIWKQDLQKVKEVLDKEFPVYKEPEIIYLEEDLSELDNITAGQIAFDYETTGIRPHAKGHKIICASVAVNENKVYSFMMPKSRKKRKPFIRLLENPNVGKIAQNMKYEDTWSVVRLKAKVKKWIWDTMLATHIIDNRSGITSLKFQAYVQFGIIDYDSEINRYLQTTMEHANQINSIEKLIETESGKRELLKYCALDSVYEYRLAKWQRKRMAGTQGLTEVSPINSDFPNAYHLLHKGILSLAKAERQGIRVDVEYCERQIKKLTKKVERIEKKLFASKFYKHWEHVTNGKINLNSGDQLGHFLYGVKKLEPAKRTASEKGSTDEEALKMLKIPELDWIIERSKLLKTRDTYLAGFLKEQVDGVLHPYFNLHTARTYRSSSSNPNFQNIPKRDKKTMKMVRRALFPRPGHQLLEMDYSGIEVGIAACYHDDPTMIKYITDGFDMHGDMAAQIFMIDNFDKSKFEHAYIRSATKNGFVFPQFYGDYFKNNAESLCGEWLKLPEGKWRKGMGIEFEGAHLSDHLISKGIKEYGEIKRQGSKTVVTGFLKHLADIEKHFWAKRFPVYAKWKESHYKNYLKEGYTSLYTGFVNKGVMGKNDAINYPIQGSAFHCLLWSFDEITEELERRGMDSKLIGQIHDAIIFDIHPEELEEVYQIVIEIGTKKLREKWKWINVPLEIDAELCPVDSSWADKEEWKPE